MFRGSNIDKLLDKATSSLLLDPDWETVLQICDLIRQGDSPPKQVLAAINKKVCSDNPHVSLYALMVLESVVKNCGGPVHDEVGSRLYMEQLRTVLKTTPHENVKTKILELLQAWAFAFRNNTKYRAVQDTVTILKAEEFKFPPKKESDAMFSADTAPEWADGSVCHRCRVQFTTLVQRKHHCRACGQVFCQQCSSKTSTLPKFGFEKEVRVCDACYDQINSRATQTAGVKVESDLPPEYLSSSLAQQSQTAPKRSEDELREEEELQLALALSQSEAEEKEKKKTKSNHLVLGHMASVKSEPSTHPEEDPELARYLDRSYWDQRNKEDATKVPSAPSHSTNMTASPISSHTNTASSTVTTTIGSNCAAVDNSSKLQQNGLAEDSEIDEFVNALRSQVEIFVNRMKSNSSRGRSIANDSSVQTLFMNITAMHSRLLRYIQQQDDNRVYYEGLQDKLAQVKDARAALDALRFEHREKLRQRAEEAERLRQMQMAQKLDIMRQKKQEYLQYQRQLALQRIQEQEREMQMRQEQQKQQYLMGGVPYNRFMPPGSISHTGVPLGLPTYSGSMYSQPGPGNPAFLGHQAHFAGHVPQGMIPGAVMGSLSNQMGSSVPQQGHQRTQMGPAVTVQVGPGGPHQPDQMGPGGPQPSHMGPGGPQPSHMGPGGHHPGQMGPGGHQPGQMGPGGPQSSQMGPGGPQPGQMGPGGPQPGQMGPGGHQPGQMGPGGPQPGQMGPFSHQPGPGGQQNQMGSGFPQQSPIGPGGPQGPVGQLNQQSGAMVINGQAPPMGQMVHLGGMRRIGVQQVPMPGGIIQGQEVKESDELISFD